MDSELAAKLLTILDEYEPVRFELPAPIDQISTVSLTSTAPNKLFLRLDVVTPLQVGTIHKCVQEDVTPFEPAGAAVVLRTWVTGMLYLQILLGDLAPQYVLIRCTPTGGLTNGVIGLGTHIGTAQSTIEVAFLNSSDPTSSYLDPAIIVRILAFLSDPYRELLLKAIEQDPSGSFGLQRFFDFYDALDEPVHQKLLYQQIIRMEFEARTSRGIPTDLVTQAFYRIRLPAPAGSSFTSADVISTYHSAVEAGLDKFAGFYLEDLNLFLAIFRADQYEMDLLDIRDPHVRFHTLATANTGCKLIVNGPVFDTNVCGKQSADYRASWYNAAVDAAERGMDFTGRTKGTLVFRGRPPEVSDCPIPDNPAVWTYHFAQGVTGNYGLFLDPIPSSVSHDYACATEPAIGVFRNGQRIGTNHEIDQLGSDNQPRKMPDEPYADKYITQGIPIIGTCSRSGTEYLFVLIRPDSYAPKLSTANWEEMIQLMRDIGVIDAFISDGDDSVGLIIDDVLYFVPGLKKDSPMPLAIGFRKV